MSEFLDEIVASARCGSGFCDGCPAATTQRADGNSLSEGVNPGLGSVDAEVMFITIEPSPAHGKVIDWDEYDWEGYNQRYYQKLLAWDSGEAMKSIIEPIEEVTTDDIWFGDSVKCPPREGEDNEVREEEFDHCRQHLENEIHHVDPEVIVAIGNRGASRTLEFLGGPSVRFGVSTQAGRRFDTNPTMLVAPSWSHGWLFDYSVKDNWGDGWVEDFPELSNESWESYLEIVQASLEVELRD